MSEKKDEILKFLQENSNPKNKEGMARFGINTEKAFGISMPLLREAAKHYKKDHFLALELWQSGYHEARILAGLIDDHLKCTSEQMEQWVLGFNSWDVCDQVCMNLFWKTEFAWDKVREWAEREEEFVRRASFALMAVLAVKVKKTDEIEFLALFPLIEKYSTDKRNFVKKAVNWALRQIGKRNRKLHPFALELAEKLMKSDDRTARWIGTDAYKELISEGVAKTLDRRDKKPK
jgi:3-methyladenine DNA glycosylase AlkD